MDNQRLCEYGFVMCGDVPSEMCERGLHAKTGFAHSVRVAVPLRLTHGHRVGHSSDISFLVADALGESIGIPQGSVRDFSVCVLVLDDEREDAYAAVGALDVCGEDVL